MRILYLLILAAVSAGIVPAQKYGPGPRQAAIYNGPRVSVNTFIWSDSYTYSPGDTAIVRRTIKTNGDLYPYTQVLYIVNNQTGAKTYLPGGNSAVTDVNGNPMGSFEATQLSDTEQEQIASIGIPNEPGMHTIVWELRDYTGGRVLKSNFMKIGVVTAEQTISGEITSDVTLTNDTLWTVSGVVFVKSGAVLTIEPGTIIQGQPSPVSAIIITTSGQIDAVGTAARPIIMTSSLPFGQRARADWGGLAMLGRAQVNVPGGEAFLEGLITGDDSAYGGDDNTHNCGSIAYLRVEFAGNVLGEGNELNGITWAGCGTDTVAHHLQSSYGEDDAFEWFGGTMHADHLMANGQEDDQFDVQLGFAGSIDHAVGFQNLENGGNRCIEADNNEDGFDLEPFTDPTFFNITCIHYGVEASGEGAVAGAELRRGFRGQLGNTVFYDFIGGAFRLSNEETQRNAADGTLTVNGMLVWENGSTDNTLEGNLRGAGSAENTFEQGPNAENIYLADPMFASLEPSDPDFQGVFGSPLYWPTPVRGPGDIELAPGVNGAAEYFGGVGPYDNWTKDEWLFFVRDADMVQ